MIFTVGNMISASKTTFSLNNLKILRPKVKKNRKKFCEFPSSYLKSKMSLGVGAKKCRVYFEWLLKMNSDATSSFRVLSVVSKHKSHSFITKSKFKCKRFTKYD